MIEKSATLDMVALFLCTGEDAQNLSDVISAFFTEIAILASERLRYPELSDAVLAHFSKIADIASECLRGSSSPKHKYPVETPS
jgi:hypothetical protein